MVTVTLFKLVAQATVDTGHRVVRFQVDVDLGVAQSRVLVTFAGDNFGGHHLGWNLGNKVDGPTRIGLLGVGHETEATMVVRVPGLAGVSWLVLDTS